MQQKIYQLHIRKEALKFSASHATVFSDGRKESFHGHNYSTEITIDVQEWITPTQTSLQEVLSFSVFKLIIKKICEEWDERILVAKKCPFYQELRISEKEVDFLLCGKRYVFPKDEIVFLNIDNITSERLAEEVCLRLVSQLDSKLLKTKILRIGVRIDESTGQGATFFWSPSENLNLPNH